MSSKKDIFVLCNDNGRISWDNINLSPYTFVKNFLLGSHSFYLGSENPDYKYETGLTEKVWEESKNEAQNPLERIKMRKVHGIEIQNPANGLEIYQVYTDSQNRKGYRLKADEKQLKYLREAKINFLTRE